MVETDGVDVRACERCPALVESRSRIVNGTGPADAALLFVGEAPGAEEDERNEPFVGRSGGVLDDALRGAGLDRTDVRITNCVRCRPPENRNPRVGELDSCAGFLKREIDRVDPELIVALGKVPAERLLGRDVAVTGESGSVVDARIDGVGRRVLICLHPAATLYDPGQREPFDEAVATAADLIGAEGGGQSRLGDY